MASGKLLKFELNRDGVKDLLKGSEMQSILSQTASEKASAAGDGYASEVHVGQNRAYANIYTGSPEAYRDNLQNNTLEKVIRT